MKNHIEGATPEAEAMALLRPIRKLKAKHERSTACVRGHGPEKAVQLRNKGWGIHLLISRTEY